MSGDPIARTPPWSHAELRESLELILEGLTELIGFQAAGALVVDGDEAEMIAIHGDAVAVLPDGSVITPADLVGTHYPLHRLSDELSRAEPWGGLRRVLHDGTARFLGADRVTSPPGPNGERGTPMSVLAAPVRDADGTLVACLNLATPVGSSSPDSVRFRLTEAYLAQATRTVLDAVERRRLSRKLQRMEEVRRVIRSASRQQSVGDVVRATGEQIRWVLDADALWVSTFDSTQVDDPGDRMTVHTFGHDGPETDPDLIRIIRQGARGLRSTRRATVIDLAAPPESDTEENALGREVMRERGFGYALVVPVRAGPDLLGVLCLLRRRSDTPWSPLTHEIAADLARDLGRLLVRLRTVEHEEQLVRRLSALDAYKRRLLTAVSDRLEEPLSDIDAQVDRIHASAPTLAADAAQQIRLRAQGLQGLLDDLLVIARLSAPSHEPPRQQVDLTSLAAKATRYWLSANPSRDLVLRHRGTDPVEVLGSPADLERLLLALMSNATKFTPDGGTVTVHTESRGGSAVLTVSDTGIGIPARDRDQVLTEFFRSSDPRVQATPGDGLGLAVVDWVVHRLDGRIEISSEVDVGTRVRVTLPLAP